VICGGSYGNELATTYLLMRKAQLVLKNCLAVDERLDFIGQRAKGLGQNLGEACVVHHIRDGEGETPSNLNVDWCCWEKREERELVSKFLTEEKVMGSVPHQERIHSHKFGRFRRKGLGNAEGVAPVLPCCAVL